MKARDSQTGTFKDVYVKALDSMPVGTQIEYTGDTIPTGWEEVNDYSTTEIDTGKKWIDGKSIYRKVLTITSVASNTPHGITNLDRVISYYGNMKRSSGVIIMIPLVFNEITYQISINGINSTEILWTKGNNAPTPSNDYPMYIVLEYTKTTD